MFNLNYCQFFNFNSNLWKELFDENCKDPYHRFHWCHRDTQCEARGGQPIRIEKKTGPVLNLEATEQSPLAIVKVEAPKQIQKKSSP